MPCWAVCEISCYIMVPWKNQDPAIRLRMIWDSPWTTIEKELSHQAATIRNANCQEFHEQVHFVVGGGHYWLNKSINIGNTSATSPSYPALSPVFNFFSLSLSLSLALYRHLMFPVAHVRFFSIFSPCHSLEVIEFWSHTGNHEARRIKLWCHDAMFAMMSSKYGPHQQGLSGPTVGWAFAKQREPSEVSSTFVHIASTRHQ